MNIKRLALISSLAGLSGCYTVPARTVVVEPTVVGPAPVVVTPAPVVVAPAPVVAPAVVVPVYRPLWRPHFYHRCRW